MAISEKDLLEPTVDGFVNPEYDYPRKVKPDPGVPAGWFAVESAFGPTSKTAGKIYTRYSSFDGRFKFLSSAKKAIENHAADKGIDPKPLLEEYVRLQKDPPEGSRLWKLKEQRKREAEEREEEREAQGRLKGEKREEMIAKFEDKFGKLSGPVVFQFPGWKTRWDYQKESAQVKVTYTDPDGGEWFVLKDLQCALMNLVENGEPGPGGADVGNMLEIGFAHADPAKFAVGARTAKETGLTYEVTADGEARTMTREESKIEREQTHEAKAAVKPKKNKKRRLCYALVSAASEGPAQEGWAKLGSESDVQLAFFEYRGLLASRGFSASCELVAVHGLTEERRYASRITGVYFCKGPYEGRSCYQKLMHAPRFLQGMCCDPIYIIWNPSQSRWEFTTKPEPRQLCIAYCTDSEEQLANVKASWQMQDGFETFQEEKSLSITVDSPGSPTGAE